MYLFYVLTSTRPLISVRRMVLNNAREDAQYVSSMWPLGRRFKNTALGHGLLA